MISFRLNDVGSRSGGSSPPPRTTSNFRKQELLAACSVAHARNVYRRGQRSNNLSDSLFGVMALMLATVSSRIRANVVVVAMGYLGILAQSPCGLTSPSPSTSIA